MLFFQPTSALLFNFSSIIQTVCLSEPTRNQPNRTKRKENIWEGSQHLMNELTELDNAGSPEPGLRLRKGHMSDTATTQAPFEEDSCEQRLLLVDPPLSSDQENVSLWLSVRFTRKNEFGYKCFSAWNKFQKCEPWAYNFFMPAK